MGGMVNWIKDIGCWNLNNNFVSIRTAICDKNPNKNAQPSYLRSLLLTRWPNCCMANYVATSSLYLICPSTYSSISQIKLFYLKSTPPQWQGNLLEVFIPSTVNNNRPEHEGIEFVCGNIPWAFSFPRMHFSLIWIVAEETYFLQEFFWYLI